MKKEPSKVKNKSLFLSISKYLRFLPFSKNFNSKNDEESNIQKLPKVHVYLLCYNEEIIIESVLRYYSEFCTRIFILDNYSTDKSIEIAKSFDKVTIIQWENNGLLDDRKHVELKTELYKLYSRKNGKYTEEVADWIIVCDMDELIYHPNILEVLKEYQDEGVTVPQITGFDIVDTDFIDTKKPLIYQYKFGVRVPRYDQRLIFQTNFNMSYSVGCHPSGPGFHLMKQTYNYKSSNKHKIAFLHYKHIGTRYVDKAEEYAERVNLNQVWRNDKGAYAGIACHYLNIVEQKVKQSPLLNHRKKIFNDDWTLKYEDFVPASGEEEGR